MKTVLLWLGRLAGFAGVAVFVLSLALRVGGTFMLAGFPVGTLFQAGVGAMVLACLVYLVRLVEFRS
jgi:hypothetical protein